MCWFQACQGQGPIFCPRLLVSSSFHASTFHLLASPSARLSLQSSCRLHPISQQPVTVPRWRGLGEGCQTLISWAKKAKGKSSPLEPCRKIGTRVLHEAIWGHSEQKYMCQAGKHKRSSSQDCPAQTPNPIGISANTSSDRARWHPLPTVNLEVFDQGTIFLSRPWLLWTKHPCPQPNGSS